MTRAAPQAADRLLRAIEAHIGPLANVTVQSRDWASATFVGMQHNIWFDAPDGTMTDDFLARLPDLEFAMPGHFVADIALIEQHRADATVRIGLTALTIVKD